MSITHLPAETLDKIAGFIESPTDLRNFAVSRQLHSIVSPRHTQFRIIRSPLLSSIWQKFTTHRSLAQNVRTLEIQRPEYYGVHPDFAVLSDPFMALGDRRRRGFRTNPSVVPEIFKEEHGDKDEQGAPTFNNERNKDLCAERLLVLALRTMTGLTSFVWSRTPPLINPNIEDDIWITLANHCPDLREVQVLDGVDSDDLGGPQDRKVVHNPSVFALRNLKSLVMVTHVGPKTPDMKLLAAMPSPNLEVLLLDFYSVFNLATVNVSPILSHSHWSSLRDLHLCPVWAPSRLFSSFLASHPTLERLCLRNYTTTISVCIPDPLVLPPGALPSLRYLSAVWQDMSPILLALPLAHADLRPLEHIHFATLDEDFLAVLGKSGAGAKLKRIHVLNCASPDLVVKLGELAPGLEWLSISSIPRHTPEFDWYSIITHFPSLTTLEGPRFLFGTRSSEANSETICELLRLCPKMRRLSLFQSEPFAVPESPRYAVIIEREGNSVRWDVRLRFPDEEGAVDHNKGSGSFEL